MSTPLRILLVEDSKADATLMSRELKRGGYDPVFERVDTATAMEAMLEQQTWDIIIADCEMPQFNGLAALELMQKRGVDLPFIIVSGTIGEETAVEAIKAGAHDYVKKGNPARLIPAINRELREAEVRQKQKQTEASLKKLEERYRMLLESSPDPIVAYDTEGKTTYINPAFTRILGWSLNEVKNKKIDFIAHEKEYLSSYP